MLLPPYTLCSTSPNQGEAGYWHALTLTLPKHLHTQNTNHGCWCPHKHDTYVMCLSHTGHVTVTAWHCDRACVPLCNFVYTVKVYVCVCGVWEEMTRTASPAWQWQMLGFTRRTSMLEFTGPCSFTSTVHVHAETFNYGANVNAHTHIMPVLSYQTHSSPPRTLPTVSAPFTVLSAPRLLFPWSSVYRQSPVNLRNTRSLTNSITKNIA